MLTDRGRKKLILSWALGGAIAALGLLRLSEDVDGRRLQLTLLGALVVAGGSALVHFRESRASGRMGTSVLYASFCFAVLALLLLSAPMWSGLHEPFGPHLGAAAAAALLGWISAVALGGDAGESVATRWAVRPLMVALLWAAIVAVGVQIAILVWYAGGQVLLKPLVGAELGFALAALTGGAAGGAFAGYLAALTLSLRPGGTAPGTT